MRHGSQVAWDALTTQSPMSPTLPKESDGYLGAIAFTLSDNVIGLGHEQIVETPGWIDPQCVLALSFVDRFPDVHQYERDRICSSVKNHFGLP